MQTSNIYLHSLLNEFTGQFGRDLFLRFTHNKRVYILKRFVVSIQTGWSVLALRLWWHVSVFCNFDIIWRRGYYITVDGGTSCQSGGAAVLCVVPGALPPFGIHWTAVQWYSWLGCDGIQLTAVLTGSLHIPVLAGPSLHWHTGRSMH